MIRKREFCHLFFIVLAFRIVQSIQVFEKDDSFFPSASEACLNAAFANYTACDESLQYVTGDPYGFYELDELERLCTSGCRANILSHKSLVSAACNNSPFYDSLNDVWFISTYLDEQVQYAFDSICLKNPAGGYCNPHFKALSTQTGGGVLQRRQTENDCDECFIRQAAVDLQSPVGYTNEEDLDSFNSAVSRCSLTGYSITEPTPPAITSTNTSTPETLQCSGTNYTVQDGDTLLSISVAHNISFDYLRQFNGLTRGGVNLPETLCLEKTCNIYTIKEGDTCDKISLSEGVTFAQLLSWNFIINLGCSNLGGYVGETICVSNPNGSFNVIKNTVGVPSTYTTPAPQPTEHLGSNVNTYCGRFYQVSDQDTCQTISMKFAIGLEDFYFLNPGVVGDCENLWADYYYCVAPVGTITTYSNYTSGQPSTSSETWILATPTPMPPGTPSLLDKYNSSGPIIPLANDTRNDCFSYYVYDPESITALGIPQRENSIDLLEMFRDCWHLAESYNVERELLVNWNPSLEQNTEDVTSPAYEYPCTLETSVSYCAYLAEPTIGPRPTRSIPDGRASGEVEGCLDYAKLPENWGCPEVEANLRVPFELFFAYNPSIKADCSGLVVGTHYCIRAPRGAVTVTIPISTTSATSTMTTPTPTQTGMVSDCQTFYKVKAEDGCYDIAAAHSIALEDLYLWNPALDNCANLWPDYYICIGASTPSSTSTETTTTVSTTSSTSTGVSTPTPVQEGLVSGCTDFYKVKDGDGCWAIANANSIPIESLYLWNPGLGSECQYLWLDYYICISGPTATSSTTPTSTTAVPVTTPTPYQANMPAGCKTFHKVVSGDYCYKIYTDAGITEAEFKEWNPDVGGDCSAIWLDYHYCIGH